VEVLGAETAMRIFEASGLVVAQSLDSMDKESMGQVQ